MKDRILIKYLMRFNSKFFVLLSLARGQRLQLQPIQRRSMRSTEEYEKRNQFIPFIFRAENSDKCFILCGACVVGNLFNVIQPIY